MDPVSSARTARESLALGLAALQSPGLPPQIMSVADPVAHAMSALHRIETSHGAAIPEAAPAALGFARHALALLQSQGIEHPAVEQAMATIARSLAVVHQLSQLVVAPAHAANTAVSPYAGTMIMDQPQLQPAAHAPVSPPGAQHAPARQAPAASPPRQQPPPPPQRAPTPAPAQPAWQPPAPAAQAKLAPAAVAGSPGTLRVDASLGAHSPTNFYKGLAGNDVVDAGGIFIATYQLLPIGTEFVVHVSLPGGYEFDSLAVVRWAREAPHSTRGEEAPPGFGAQFLQISPEGRQLVYRYVRNREPLFYDDL